MGWPGSGRSCQPASFPSPLAIDPDLQTHLHHAYIPGPRPPISPAPHPPFSGSLSPPNRCRYLRLRKRRFACKGVSFSSVPCGASFARCDVETRGRCGSADGVSPSTEPVFSCPFLPPCQKPAKTSMPRSGEVESVKVHDLVPGRYKVVQELLHGVLRCVDFRQGPELGVRTED
jgi:hypothetical protein